MTTERTVRLLFAATAVIYWTLFLPGIVDPVGRAALYGPIHAAGPEPEAVVFVCEHGSVKSLMAAEWFNRIAAERKLAVRARSRAVAPDPAVPAPIAGHLRSDGFDVAGFVPARVTEADVAGARRVVAIGVDPAVLPRVEGVPVERWDDIPPASTGYAAARDALRARIERLLERFR